MEGDRYTLALAALATLILALKLLPVPLAVMVVGSGSMRPAMEVGDLVVVAGKNYHVGDVVVWCRGARLCVVHRVVRIADGYVVTKGDANPAPDPPVPRGLVKGRVALVVPRYVWVPVAMPLLLYALARAIAGLSGAYGLRGAGLVFLIMLFYLSSAVVFYLAASMDVVGPSAYTQPLGYLAAASLRGDTLVIRYTFTGGLALLRVEALQVDSTPLQGYEYNSTTITARIPQGLLGRVARESQYLRVSVYAQLTKNATLRGSYRVLIPMRPLTVKHLGHTLLLCNPNPYPVNVTLRIQHAPRPGAPWQVEEETATAAPGACTRVALPSDRYVYVDYAYTLGGATHKGRV
ncbi:MAG: signal peptidase I [Desulfurococcales archaeon]|nr:signal peptidase I [Desulfurococcales archaeon]